MLGSNELGQYASLKLYPCPTECVFPSVSMEIVVPVTCLHPSAKRFDEMSMEDDGAIRTHHYSYILETFFAISYRLNQRIPGQVRLFMTKVVNPTEVDRDGVLILPQERHENRLAPPVPYTHIRIQCISLVPSIGFDAIFKSLVDDVLNADEKKKQEGESHGTIWAVSGKKLPLTKFVHRLNEGAFRESIRYVNNISSRADVPIAERIKEVQPSQMFAAVRQLSLLFNMRRRILHPEYVNAIEHKFPFNGKYTFEICPHQWSPVNWQKIAFPWELKPLNQSTMSTRQEFINQRGGGDNIVSAEDFAQFALGGRDPNLVDAILSHSIWTASEFTNSPDKLAEVYDREVNLLYENTLQLTEDRWKDENRIRYQRVHEIMRSVLEVNPNDKELHDKMYIQLQRDALVASVADFFNTVWQPGSKVCPARKACIKWYHEQLEKSGHFSFTRHRVHTNLSTFGDLMVSNANTLEALYSIAHMHQNVTIFRFAQYHTQLGTPFHANQLVLGQHSAGKSFASDCAKKGMIDGTYECVNKITPAALTGMTGNPLVNPEATHTNDNMMFIFDDVQPSLLNVVGFGQQVRDGQGNDTTALMKSMMTSGFVDLSTVVIDEHGHRMKVSVRMKSRTCFFAHSNVEASQLPGPELSRWMLLGVTHDTREDSQTTTDKSNERCTPEMKAKLDIFNERSKRTQCFAAIIGMLIDGLQEFAPEVAIDLTVARHLLVLLNQETSKNNTCDMNLDPRTKERIEFLQIGAMLEDVMDRFFDIEVSPYHKRPWDPLNIIHMLPHLNVLQEHFTFVTGMLSTGFENRSKTVIDRALYAYALKNGHEEIAPPSTSQTEQPDVVQNSQAAENFPMFNPEDEEKYDSPPRVDILNLDDDHIFDDEIVQPDVVQRSVEVEPIIPAVIPELIDALPPSKLCTDATIPPDPKRAVFKKVHWRTKPGATNSYYPCYVIRAPIYTNSKFPTQESFISDLTNWIADSKSIAIDHQTSYSLLKQLCEPTTPVRCFAKDADGKFDLTNPLTDRVPRLIINQSEIVVAYDRHYAPVAEHGGANWFMNDRKRSGLQQSLEVVLSHNFADGRDFIYGASVKGRPYEYTLMTIPRGHRSLYGTTHLLRNFAHRPDSVVRAIEASFAEKITRIPENEELEMDFDRWVVETRWINEFCSEKEKMLLPSPIPVQLMRQVYFSEYLRGTDPYVNAQRVQAPVVRRNKRRSNAEIHRDTADAIYARIKPRIAVVEVRPPAITEDDKILEEYHEVLTNFSLLAPSPKYTHLPDFDIEDLDLNKLAFGLHKGAFSPAFEERLKTFSKLNV